MIRPGRGRRRPTAGWVAPREPRVPPIDPPPGQSSAAILRRRPRGRQDASCTGRVPPRDWDGFLGGGGGRAQVGQRRGRSRVEQAQVRWQRDAPRSACRAAAFSLAADQPKPTIGRRQRACGARTPWERSTCTLEPRRQRGQLLQELGGLGRQMRRAVAPRLPQLDQHAPIGAASQPLLDRTSVPARAPSAMRPRTEALARPASVGNSSAKPSAGPGPSSPGSSPRRAKSRPREL